MLIYGYFMIIMFLQVYDFVNAYKNLAVHKQAWQSSNYQKTREHAPAAVDGNRTQTRTYWSCALCAKGETGTWGVDLGRKQRIHHIDIYYRNDDWKTSKGRFAGFFLYVSNTTNKETGRLCYHKILNESHPSEPFMSIDCVQNGRYVIYYNERRHDVKYPDYYSKTIINELCEIEVYGCDGPGFYGEQCDQPCPQNCKNRYCDLISGYCFTCYDGYKGNLCNQQCDSQYYGPGCSSNCGHCLGSPCNHVNGTCENGCAAGWRGEKCEDECFDGTYGLKCIQNCSVNCYSNTSLLCDKVKGKCTSGCVPGWEGELCNNACNYFYGAQCKTDCGNCLDGGKCNHINGKCPRGCDAGSRGDNCDIECPKTVYGPDCKHNCSSECVNRTCDAVTGLCIQRLYVKQISDNNMGSTIGGVFGGIICVCLLAAGVFLYLRRVKQQKDSEASKRYNKHDALENTKTFSNLYENVGSENKTTSSTNDTVHVRVKMEDDEEKVYVNNTAKDEILPDIPVNQLEQVIIEKRQNDDEAFRNEYSSFPFGEMYPCSVGKKEKNLKKNRFKTTFPYDHSRVKLQSTYNDNADYINANYIDGMDRKKSYIATQGPKEGTIKDFWRMIWEEDVTQIVMLTNIKEGIKNKCAKYWPDIRENLVSGAHTIITTAEKEQAVFVLRKMTIKHNMTKKSKVVTQYHYTAWPDHGIPDTLCLVTFHQYVIRDELKSGSSPVVVHCSAGIGRTGTYIAIDALYKYGLKTKKVNIPEYLKTMRKDRMNMVQTYEQYVTIFLTLDEAFKAPVKMIPVAEFAAHFKNITKDIPANQNSVRREFQLLLKIQQKYNDSDFKLAEENSGLSNRTSILPLDKYSLHLMTSVPNRGTYINAITVPSFTKLKQFTIVPYPENDSVVDLLRLLVDHASKTIVLLDPVSGITSSDMWIPKESMISTVEPFCVTFKSVEIKDTIETLKIGIMNKKEQNSTMQVSILAPKCKINKGVNIDTGTIRELVTTLLSIDVEGLVTVMSRNGASVCGLFCALFNVIQQMRLDDEVDIFTAVRQLQVRRPELCSSMDEYQACYKAIAEHILYTSDHVYNN